MREINSDLFTKEKDFLEEVKALIQSQNYDEELVLDKFSIMTQLFEKLVKDAESIIKINGNQQEYLCSLQNDFKKEMEGRIRAEEKLKYFAAIETLTGVYNRGMGFAFLENKIKSIREHGSYFSVCYIDLNGLKYVNDNFGYFEGDELLVLICKFIKEVITDSDTLCRLGGDEFIILFPKSDKKDVEETIKKIIFNIEIQNKNKLKPYAISFSYGIVEVNRDDHRSIDEIIQVADAKMCLYKQNIRRKQVEN